MVAIITLIALISFIGVALIRRSKNKLSKLAELKDEESGVKVDQEVVRRRISIKNELDKLDNLVNNLEEEE